MLTGVRLQACMDFVTVIKDEAGACAALSAATARLLDAAQAQDRDLTDWEKVNLLRAIAALVANQVWEAWTALDLAMIAPEHVSPGAFRAEDSASVAHIRIADFRAHLEEIDRRAAAAA